MGISLVVLATAWSLLTRNINPASLSFRLGILGVAMALFPWVEAFRARYGRRRRRPDDTPVGTQTIAGRFQRALFVSYDLPIFPIRGRGTIQTDRLGMRLTGRPHETPLRAWIHVAGLLATGFTTALALLLTPKAWWYVGGLLVVWLLAARWAPRPPRSVERLIPWDHVELVSEGRGGRVVINVRPPSQMIGYEKPTGAIYFRPDAKSRLFDTIAEQLGLARARK